MGPALALIPQSEVDLNLITLSQIVQKTIMYTTQYLCELHEGHNKNMF
jgi:hypothetical protein